MAGRPRKRPLSPQQVAAEGREGKRTRLGTAAERRLALTERRTLPMAERTIEELTEQKLALQEFKNRTEAQDARDLQDIRTLCATFDHAFDMPSLRSLVWYWIRTGRIRSISERDVWSLSRRQMCQRLDQELNGVPVPEASFVAQTVRDSQDLLPSWAFDATQIEIISDPVVVSSGKAYQRQTVQSLMATGNPRDPITSAPLDNVSYPDESLRFAINDWLVEHTGFPLSEIESKVVPVPVLAPALPPLVVHEPEAEDVEEAEEESPYYNPEEEPEEEQEPPEYAPESPAYNPIEGAGNVIEID